MAVGHTRQKSRKGGKVEQATAALKVEDEARDSTANSTDVPVTIHLEMTTPIEPLNNFDPSSTELPKSEGATSVPRSSADASPPDTASRTTPLTKSAKRRLALTKKKQARDRVVEVDAVAVEDLEQVSRNSDETNSSKLPSQSNDSAKNLSNTSNSGSKKNKEKRVFTKEQQADYLMKKQRKREVQALQAAQEEEISGGGTPLSQKPSKTKPLNKKIKQKSKQTPPGPLLQGNGNISEESPSGGNCEVLLDSRTTDTEHTVVHQPDIENKYSNPTPPRSHARQKSMDVKLHLNGKQHKLMSVESPEICTSPSKEMNDRPLKVRLPGREVTLVYPDEIARPYAKQFKHRSQATSISSQASCPSVTNGSHGMRSRQSSHTTVGTTGPLESKLQSMILSHASDSTPMTATSSMASQPPQSTRSMSPIAIKASHSAPPIAPKSLNDVSQPSTEHAGYGANQVKESTQIGQVPPVPTVFQARPSQVQAPPSLGPPQPQNFPEQFPSASHYNPMVYSSTSMGYGSHYPQQMQYYNYYPVPSTQNYNPYHTSQMGVQLPYYDQSYLSNGMVYYSPDGTPMYSQQEYYPQNYLYPTLYQQQPFDS